LERQEQFEHSLKQLDDEVANVLCKEQFEQSLHDQTCQFNASTVDLSFRRRILPLTPPRSHKENRSLELAQARRHLHLADPIANTGTNTTSGSHTDAPPLSQRMQETLPKHNQLLTNPKLLDLNNKRLPPTEADLPSLRSDYLTDAAIRGANTTALTKEEDSNPRHAGHNPAKAVYGAVQSMKARLWPWRKHRSPTLAPPSTRTPSRTSTRTPTRTTLRTLASTPTPTLAPTISTPPTLARPVSPVRPTPPTAATDPTDYEAMMNLKDLSEQEPANLIWSNTPSWAYAQDADDTVSEMPCADDNTSAV
jgi:hypothetical protein